MREVGGPSASPLTQPFDSTPDTLAPFFRGSQRREDPVISDSSSLEDRALLAIDALERIAEERGDGLASVGDLVTCAERWASNDKEAEAFREALMAVCRGEELAALARLVAQLLDVEE
jgi:hypothetical protein